MARRQAVNRAVFNGIEVNRLQVMGQSYNGEAMVEYRIEPALVNGVRGPLAIEDLKNVLNTFSKADPLHPGQYVTLFIRLAGFDDEGDLAWRSAGRTIGPGAGDRTEYGEDYYGNVATGPGQLHEDDVKFTPMSARVIRTFQSRRAGGCRPGEDHFGKNDCLWNSLASIFRVPQGGHVCVTGSHSKIDGPASFKRWLARERRFAWGPEQRNRLLDVADVVLADRMLGPCHRLEVRGDIAFTGERPEGVRQTAVPILLEHRHFTVDRKALIARRTAARTVLGSVYRSRKAVRVYVNGTDEEREFMATLSVKDQSAYLNRCLTLNGQPVRQLKPDAGESELATKMRFSDHANEIMGLFQNPGDSPFRATGGSYGQTARALLIPHFAAADTSAWEPIPAGGLEERFVDGALHGSLCSAAGTPFEPFSGHAFQMDVNSSYPDAMRSGLMLPVGEPNICTLPPLDPAKLPTTGIYRIELEANLATADCPLRAYCRSLMGDRCAYVTSIEIRMMRKAGLEPRLMQDGQPNAAVYARKDLIASKTVFGGFVDKLYKRKYAPDGKSRAAIKRVLVAAWGVLATKNKRRQRLEKGGRLEGPILEWTGGCDFFIKDPAKGLFSHPVVARMAPFIRAFAFERTVKFITKAEQEFGARCVRLHTDGFILAGQLSPAQQAAYRSQEARQKLGGLKLEKVGICTIEGVNRLRWSPRA